MYNSGPNPMGLLTDKMVPY